MLPKVYRTEGDVVDFDPEKIFLSVLNETGMTEEKARNVTELVMRRIISSGMKFLSGPHIREIVCSILSENHYEQERKLYTRIGMPLMDYEEILETGGKEKTKKLINPERVHNLSANQLAREYTLLRILTDEESRAHLSGDIYIHQLKYFELRPYSQIWDPRIILKYGLPPQGNWKVPFKSKPAQTLRDAIKQLVFWLGMNHNEFSGNQGFFLVSIFLAPYAKDLSAFEIQREIKELVTEINWLYSITGARFDKSSICCTPTILNEFKELPAVGYSGNIIGNYEDYENECQSIFNAFTEVYRKGDYNNHPFKIPRRLVYFHDEWISNFENAYSDIYQEITTMKTPILVNSCLDWVQDRFNIDPKKNYMQHGVLQKLSLNLPRYAYQSNNEGEFFNHLKEKMELCFDILKKKYDIIKRRLETKHLPLCNGMINGIPLYHLDSQLLSIS